MASSAQQNARRRRLTHRALPTAVAVAAAVVVALLLAFVGQSDAEQSAERLARAWERGDARGMHAALAPAARRAVRRRTFARAYARAGSMSTATSVLAGEPHEEGGRVRLPVSVRTRAFGEVRGEVSLPVLEDGLGWAPETVFPGLAPGERLSRRTEAPRRAAILAGDGRLLADGPASERRVGLGRAGASVAGAVGPAPSSEEADVIFARGFPPGTPVGVSGLERILDRRLLGTAGGRLLAGRRTLAVSRPRASAAVRTTIDPGSSRPPPPPSGSGSAASRRSTRGRGDPGAGRGGVLGPSTPGVDVQDRDRHRRARVPRRPPSVALPRTDQGGHRRRRPRERQRRELRRHLRRVLRAVVQLGLRPSRGARGRAASAGHGAALRVRGVAAGPRSSREPAPAPRGARLAARPRVDSHRAGQAAHHPLRMASVAQTVAAGGRRLEPSVVPVAGRRAPGVRVTSPEVATTLGRMMVEVVRDGTGERAALPGVRVAGKTGTAELEDTTSEAPGETSESDASDTDAWFTAFAPAREPRIAVAVMLVRAGAGGESAAPAAREVLKAGLEPARGRRR
ncbi:MAG: penicillin-binding transpeptidase domain-containing protein [Thermoleophilaceae bacterium]